MAPRIERACFSTARASAASSSAIRSSAFSGAVTQTSEERRPGSGTSVNGPWRVWNSLEMSPMIALVREDRGQRLLRVGPGAGAESRPPSRSLEARPSAATMRDARIVLPSARRTARLEPLSSAVSAPGASTSLHAAEPLGCDRQMHEAGDLAHGLGERLDQGRVLHVPAEGVEVDLVGLELHGGGSKRGCRSRRRAASSRAAPRGAGSRPTRPNASSRLTEPSSSATVRPSRFTRTGPTSAVE